MNISKKISIKGNIHKREPSWTASIPIILLTSHSLTPKECIESLRQVIHILITPNPFVFNIEISDMGMLIRAWCALAGAPKLHST